jgi:hyperosmotically inducible protein
MLQPARSLRLSLLVGVATLYVGTVCLAAAPWQESRPPAADNTEANRGQDTTADQQKENKQDRVITQQIRKAIVADKSLSSYAHNVKVITRNGAVTLRGPVRSEDEKSAIEAMAKTVAGVDSVQDELTVAPKKAKGQS